MDKIVLNKDSSTLLEINKDSYIVIGEDVQTKSLEFNIIGCKATIVDIGNVSEKVYNFEDSEVALVEVINDGQNKKLFINNSNSNIEYSVIDLSNKDVNYNISEKSNSYGSNNIINIASVCYKEKNKNFVINTANCKGNTVNEINCFGIVKDKSILNYDVTSLIEKGSKKATVRQNSNILLFDSNSMGKNNPVLLIEENDVKASHGSSIGKIDDDTMFYLCSRGLTKNEATNLICLGKVEYLIKKIDDEKIKENLINSFKERMG